MENRKNQDSVTLKNMSGTQKPPKLLLESSKPTIAPQPQSDLLQRLRGFLPEMAAANSEMSTAPVMEFKVLQCEESSSDSDSSDSDSDSDEDASPDQEMAGGADGQYVEMDINLFQSKDEVVGNANMEAQEVDDLPTAFKASEDTSSGTEGDVPVKKLIEVIDP